MIIFSTLVEIDSSLTKDKFIELVIEWNQNSPFEDNIIKDIQWNGERNIKFGDDKLWLDIEEFRKSNTIAVRYVKCDPDGVVWKTDYVMNFTSMRMAIRLDRSFTKDSSSTERKFSTPHFIQLLIDKNYIKKDNGLAVTDKPLYINDSNLNLLADIINGKSKYRLPVVYVSRTYKNESPVNPDFLGKRLRGIAHILVQEDKSTNQQIKEMCNGNNEYFGQIGIYYPNKTIEHRRYKYTLAEGYDSFLREKVVRSVIQQATSELIDSSYTYDGVLNELLYLRLTKAKEEKLAAQQAIIQAEEEATKLHDSLDQKDRMIEDEVQRRVDEQVNLWIETIDAELENLKKRIERLTSDNERLEYENRGLHEKLEGSESSPVIYAGDEYDLYPGEIKDVILTILEESLSNNGDKKRRRNIVNDIIKHNDFKRTTAANAEKIKTLLNNYDGMTASLRSDLKSIGIDIEEDGKHYKLTFHGDERYMTTLSKTPSDKKRTGKNCASTINGLIF